jgi:prepilin-type N-terminal cleavage/methylation domain-containing protein
MFIFTVKAIADFARRVSVYSRAMDGGSPPPFPYSLFSLLFMQSRTLRRGFTLIELLLVIGIIAILASIVIVAINPTKQLGDARDAQRRSDVNTILNAVYQYAIDNNGNLPAGITTVVSPICQADVETADCTVAPYYGVSLRALTGSYLVSIPKDPRVTATGTGTRYNIVRDANGRITVSAPGAEQDTNISVTR